jgi:hypothetical protein
MSSMQPGKQTSLDDMTAAEREGLAKVLAALNLSAINRGAAGRWRVAEDQAPALDLHDALAAAVNILRDSVECGRMPSGELLPPDAVALHERCAYRLDHMRRALPPSVGD